MYEITRFSRTKFRKVKYNRLEAICCSVTNPVPIQVPLFDSHFFFFVMYGEIALIVSHRGSVCLLYRL